MDANARRPPAAAPAPRHLALLLALCLGLYLPGLFTLPPTDRDEARFAQASRQMLERGDFVDIRFQDKPRYKKPIGIYWLQSASATLTGRPDAIWSYRLPSLLGATLAVLLTAWIGARIFDPLTGFTAATLLALSVTLGIEARLAKTDAVLLATVCAAQGVLARAYRDRVENDRLPWGESLLFWAALGAGILMKGPIILLVTGTTALVLSVLDRRAAWLRGLRPWPGSLVTLAIVVPWLVAIALATKGAFFVASVGHDMLGKVVEGQESHGAPPGYFALLVWPLFWPSSLFLALALPWIVRHRRDEPVRFCLAWIVPSWLVFELVPTKLPHYVLPLLPAVALLAAAAARRGFATATDLAGAGRRRWPAAVALVWLAVGVAIAAAVAALPVIADHRLSPAAVVGALAALACSLIAVRRLREGRHGAVLLAMTAGALVLYASAYEVVLPRLSAPWIARAAARAVGRARPCARPAVAAAGFGEPSLVFLLGTRTRLVDGDEAADQLLAGRCAVALVARNQEGPFRGRLSAHGTQPIAVDSITGFNYSHGKWVTLTVYRLADSSVAVR